ncbi:hypothetical protein HDV00_002115 [Rhizophlyctis rosea]|nr:hypothetical protein HDV00_002115 [Rhizophlyctis rosea]
MNGRNNSKKRDDGVLQGAAVGGASNLLGDPHAHMQTNELTMNSMELRALASAASLHPEADTTPSNESLYRGDGEGTPLIPLLDTTRMPIADAEGLRERRTNHNRQGTDESDIEDIKRRNQGMGDGQRGGGYFGSRRGSYDANIASPLMTSPSFTSDGANSPDISHGCVICQRPLRSPSDEGIIPLKRIKPRFMRHLKRMFPTRNFNVQDGYLCVRDVQAVLSSRIEHLLEEDRSQFSRLQEDAMKNAAQYELEEEHWQDIFEKKPTLGEASADLVAEWGGSWKFLIGLLGFLAIWMIINLILGKFGSAWDEYPFVLLNLFLSTLAATQAPIIMMSQNRQAERDRAQDNYISKITMRTELHVRHLDAKMDHLLSYQWKRLLEIQELQIDLLQILQAQNRSPTSSIKPRPSREGSPKSSSRRYWTIQTQPDEHLDMLLKHYFKLVDSGKDYLLFSRWHEEGDNFVGVLSGVEVEWKRESILKSLRYEVGFLGMGATLDDVLSGEGTVELRNDFDMPGMEMAGRLIRVEMHTPNRIFTYANGELPPRYKPSFATNRVERISDFWKMRVNRLVLTYAPPPLVAVVDLSAGQTLRRIDASFFSTPNQKHATLYCVGHRIAADGNIWLSHLVGPRPLPDEWKEVARCEWPEVGKARPSATSFPPDGGEGKEIKLPGVRWKASTDLGEEAEAPINVPLDLKLRGPGRYLFYCAETRVAFHGIFEDVHDGGRIRDGTVGEAS